jgi:spore coat protein U-like protein
MNSRIRLVTALAGITGVALVTFLWTPVTAATATASLAVSASVSNSCTISTTALAFGAYDPIGGAAVDNTGGLVITCNKNTGSTIGLALGAHAAGSVRNMVGAPTADLLAYELYSDAGRTAIWGNAAGSWVSYTAPDKNPHTVTVYGRVTGGQDVSVGAYSDSVLATVTF